MPQHGGEPTLPPPPCGACGDAFSTRAIRWVRNHHGHTERKRVLESYAWWWWIRLVVVVVVVVVMVVVVVVVVVVMVVVVVVVVVVRTLC